MCLLQQLWIEREMSELLQSKAEGAGEMSVPSIALGIGLGAKDAESIRGRPFAGGWGQRQQQGLRKILVAYPERLRVGRKDAVTQLTRLAQIVGVQRGLVQVDQGPGKMHLIVKQTAVYAG